MRYIVLLFIIICFAGCSIKSFYPLIGGTAGAGAGAVVGGPGGAALGGFSGVAAGELAKKEGQLAEVEEALKTAEAVSKGDVEKLLKLHTDKQKSMYDQLVEGVYDILKISAFGMALYFIFQFWYGRRFAEKLNKKNLSK